MGQDEITGANFRVYRPAPGYVRCDHPDGAEVSGQDARDVMHAIATVADGGPEHAGTTEQLLNAADTALYRAKSNGRNQVRAAS